jgi:hypothetical protein
MPFHHKRNVTPLAIKATQLGFVVPRVIAHRLTRLAMAGVCPTARDQNEFRRMGTEKMAAFTESWNAMTMEALRINQTLVASSWRSVWLPWHSVTPSMYSNLHNAALGVLGKGLAPFHRRAVANARRLARTKLF